MKENSDDLDTLEAGLGDQLDDAAEGDLQMAEETSQEKKTVKRRTGFHRYLCAEHVDSLT